MLQWSIFQNSSLASFMAYNQRPPKAEVSSIFSDAMSRGPVLGRGGDTANAGTLPASE